MKKQILRLDFEDTEPDFNDYAFMLFHSLTPGYAFVDDFNRLYGFSLARLDDMVLYDTQWPLYLYDMPIKRLRLFLVEKPAGVERLMPRWMAGQKLLIAKGDDAALRLGDIYNDFLAIPALPPEGDFAAKQRYDILSSFQEGFTTVTMLDINAEQPLPPKAARELADTRQLLAAILDYLDIKRIG